MHIYTFYKDVSAPLTMFQTVVSPQCIICMYETYRSKVYYYMSKSRPTYFVRKDAINPRRAHPTAIAVPLFLIPNITWSQFLLIRTSMWMIVYSESNIGVRSVVYPHGAVHAWEYQYTDTIAHRLHLLSSRINRAMHACRANWDGVTVLPPSGDQFTQISFVYVLTLDSVRQSPFYTERHLAAALRPTSNQPYTAISCRQISCDRPSNVENLGATKRTWIMLLRLVEGSKGWKVNVHQNWGHADYDKCDEQHTSLHHCNLICYISMPPRIPQYFPHSKTATMPIYRECTKKPSVNPPFLPYLLGYKTNIPGQNPL